MAAVAVPAETAVPAYLYADSDADHAVEVIRSSMDAVVNTFGRAGFTNMIVFPAESDL